MRYIIMIAAILAASVAYASPASAGCLGGAVGDACIGIPTPHEHRIYREPEHRSVVIERHRHDHPVVIERHRHYDYDDED
jgi:hypothetical protein